MRTPRLLAITTGAVAACASHPPAPSPAPAPTPTMRGHVAATPSNAPTPAGYPAARRDDVVDDLHGTKVADPYRWLEDASQPEVQAWMKAEDDFARDHLRKLPGRDGFAKELEGALRYDETRAPIVKKGRYFYEKKLAQKDKRVVYWRDGARGEERVLLDPNTWSTDNSAGLSGWWPSRDGRYVAYNVNLHGADDASMKVIEVATGRELPDLVPGTGYGGASWTPDDKGFYYTFVPEPGAGVAVADRPGLAELRHHTLGDDPAKDVLVHEATHDATTDLAGGVSDDGHWLEVEVWHGDVSSDVWFRDTRAKGAAATTWTPLAVGNKDASYRVREYKDVFYVLTNDGAPRYHVFRVDPKKPARAGWKEVVAADPDATIRDIEIIGGHLVVNRLRDAVSEVEVVDLDGGHPRALAIPSPGDVEDEGGIQGEPDADTAYLEYGSYTDAGTVLEASIAKGTVTEWSKVALPLDLSKVVVDHVHYPSKDGTQIGLFVVHRADVTPTGHQPTILSGYGGFDLAYPPRYWARYMSWVAHGGVFAWAAIRGGNEGGEDWHRHGMLGEKQHVFDDFLAGAAYLEQSWTDAHHLGITGGSNGGLLVGAAMTQRPDLLGAVVCSRPLLDMLRYQKFGWGATWTNEYGSADDAAQFPALYAYSPYHHVAADRPYPPLLMLSSDSDDRVDPLHARKFVAAIQAARPNGAITLLRIEKNAGHFGADVVSAKIEEGADELAFFAFVLGLAP